MDRHKIAAEAGLAPTTVDDFYNGTTVCPTFRTFKRIARVVDVRIAMHEAGAPISKTHELQLTPKQRRFVRALIRQMREEK